MRNWNNHYHKPLLYRQFVFTVPMRNWNLAYADEMGIEGLSFYSTYEELKLITFVSNSLIGLWFLQYLWGIETEVCWHDWSEWTAFLQYLWGIETTA